MSSKSCPENTYVEVTIMMTRTSYSERSDYVFTKSYVAYIHIYQFDNRIVM